jgi:uncharacterized membrane protein YbhN (UPF0104 family)
VSGRPAEAEDRAPVAAAPDAPQTPEDQFGERHADAAADEAARLGRGIVSLLILAVLVGALVLAVPGLRGVASRLRAVDPAWLAVAIVLELASCAGYVLAFQLVFRRVPRLLATRVALSEMAFNAVLPAGGAGGIAIGAWIAKAKGGSVRRFTERSAVLFLLTSAVNVTNLALTGLLVGFGVLDAPHHVLLGYVPAGVALAALGGFASIPVVARRPRVAHSDARAARWLRLTGRIVEDALGELRRGDWRLLGAVAYLWCDIAVMWTCLHAFGASMPIGALTLGYQIGYLGNILPIPGGIGALDGGLAGALILYGAEPASAAAAVLLYHAIVLWVPTLLGTVAFLRLRATLDEPLQLRPDV